ncbi:hypothetical protein [Crocosphaera sp.]|uniref:hypothetical protein n=1 Tax=Crocosphaera sp. TaxID=2729996 RepID=UPI00262687C9|nr:hypothetical protein [Crocosphaera sp.]MDJ0582987.1 hypothetical protein [Crocosphaera sp.]
MTFLLVLIFYFIFFGAIALGIWLYIRSSLPNSTEKLIFSVIPLLIILLLSLILQEIFQQPSWPINGGRLIPSFALSLAYPLYPSPGDGPAWSALYGPVTAITYLPTTLTVSPTDAILLGSIITAIIFFLPVLLLHIAYKKNIKHVSLGLFTFIGWCFYVLSSPSLTYSAFRIHADGIALGFGGLAMVFIYFRHHYKSIVFFILSAICITLSIWSKQVILPIIVALPIYILFADGRRHFLSYLLCIISSFIIISGIFLLVFDPASMFHNLIVIPGSHPWDNSNKLIALVGSTRQLLKFSLLPIITVIFVISLYFKNDIQTVKNIREWLKNNPWIASVALAIFLIPSSSAGFSKVGGDVNAFSFTLYFISIAASLALLQLSIGEQNIFVLPDLIPSLAKLFIVISIIAFTITELPPSFPTLARTLTNFRNNSTETAFLYAKKYPYETFFPWQTLGTIMADRKIYHFVHGINDRNDANLPMNQETFKAYLPPKFQRVAFPNKINKNVMTYLPEFNQKVEISELPGWTVYEKNNP